MTEITVLVDSEIAEFYKKTSEIERNSIANLITRELRRQMRIPQVIRLLRETSEISKSNGMTLELLEQLLNDDESSHA